MGQNHLRVLSMLRGVEVAFVSDEDPKKLRDCEAKFGVRAAMNWKEELHGLDALIICTPTATHLETLEVAAPLIKNFFVEKPLAASIEQVRHVIALRDQFNLFIQVGFIERFNSALAALRVQWQELPGCLVCADFTRTNRLSSRITDVDVISDLMVHDIDLALYLSGPVTQIAAQGFEIDGQLSWVSSNLTHANGSFSRIQASRISEKKMRRIELTFPNIFVDCDLLRREILLYSSESDEIPGTPEVRRRSVQEAIDVPPSEALVAELQAFLSLCRNRSSFNGVLAPHVVEDSLAVMKVCDEIRERV
jgi:predicted dehydrogenase